MLLTSDKSFTPSMIAVLVGRGVLAGCVKIKAVKTIAVVLAIIVGCATPVHAQTDRGWIEGLITDKATGAELEGVEIAIRDLDGIDILRSTSGASGHFLVAGIPSGEYDLQLRKQNRPDYRIRSVSVRGGCQSLVNIQMEENASGTQTSVVLDWREEPSLCEHRTFDTRHIDALPSARNIWYLLETQDPSTVTETIDEGGLQTGIVTRVGVHGGTWTQNGYRWDDLDITNPYEPGKPLTYATFRTLQEFRVDSAFHFAATAAPGGEFQLISRRGRGTFHGEAEAYYLGDPLQSNNLDDRLRGFGFQTAPHFRRFPEAEVALGGPVRRQQGWTYFASFGIQHVSRIIPDFAASPTTNVYSGLLRGDAALSPRDELAVLVSGQVIKHSHLGARPGIEPSATLLGNDRFELVHGHWTHRYSDRSVSQLSFGFSHSSPTDTLQHGLTRPSYTRLFTGEMSGAAPLESDAALSRFSLLGRTQSFRAGAGTGLRQFSVGFDIEQSLATEEQRVFQGIQLFLFPATFPSEVAEFNTPSHAMQRLRELSFFGEARFQIARRMSLRVGSNLNSSHAFLPSQVSGAGVFAPVRKFAGNRDVISWLSLSPRVHAVIPLFQRLGETAMVAGYARYYHLLPAAYADFANPNALGGRLYRWEDRNVDGIFQRGEEGTLLRAFGGPFSAVDPNLKRPFTDEWGIGIEHNLRRSIRASVRLFERDSKRWVQPVNIGVSSSAYTPVSVFDAGDDAIPGTGDDRVVTVFNQDPRTMGQDRYMLTNPPGLNTTQKALEATIRTRLTDRGFLTVSFTAYKSEGQANPGNSVVENDPGVIGSLFSDPNTLINSRGRLFFDRGYVAKVAGSARAPLGLQLGSVVSYFDGLPFGRRLIVANLNQGPFFIMATPRGEPGGVRTQFNLNFDQRISRDFEVGNQRLSAMLDVFNVLNLNKSLREFDISGPLFAGRKPLDIQNPRVFRAGIRLNF